MDFMGANWLPFFYLIKFMNTKKNHRKCANPNCNNKFKMCLSCIKHSLFSWKTVCCSHLCFIEYMKWLESKEK